MNGTGKKAYLDVNWHGQSIKVRAVCIVFRDSNGDCYMREESRSRKTVGFCGGVCVEYDENIGHTIIRKIYEEILTDLYISKEDWLQIRKSILESPNDEYEQFLNAVYHTYTHAPIYVQSLRSSALERRDGRSQSEGDSCLNILYIQLHPGADMLRLFRYKSLVAVSLDTIHIIVEMRMMFGSKVCEQFTYIAKGIPIHIRIREIMLIDNMFLNYLKYGISYIGKGLHRHVRDFSKLLRTFHKQFDETMANGVLDNFDRDFPPAPGMSSSTGTRVLPKSTPIRLSKSQGVSRRDDFGVGEKISIGEIRENREILRQAILLNQFQLSAAQWHEVFDHWHKVGSVKIGWYVWCVLYALHVPSAPTSMRVMGLLQYIR